MFWLSYECFSILCNAFLLKRAISSHNSSGIKVDILDNCVSAIFYKDRNTVYPSWKNSALDRFLTL